MERTCQCGGIIRQQGKPFFDILPSCSCQNPVAITPPTIIISTTTGTLGEPTKDL